jgi:hypothetical protein
MAALDHLNTAQVGNFVRLHRGFAGVHHKEIDMENLGVHWVGDDKEHLADLFATRDYTFDESGKGTVLTGLVHKRHILDPESPEWEDWANIGEGFAWSEKEVPLKTRTPVHIIGATNFRESGKDTTHKFKKPKRGWV